MTPDENNTPPSSHQNISPEEVQDLIDRRMAFLIDKEKEEAAKSKPGISSDSHDCFLRNEVEKIKKWFAKKRKK